MKRHFGIQWVCRLSESVRALAVLAFVSALAAAPHPGWAQNPRLESESRVTYGISIDTSFSHYDYDAAGNRIAKRSYASADTASAPLGVTENAYDSHGRLFLEITRVGTDTVTRADYAYDAQARSVVITLLGSGGKLRFVDSLLYDAQKRLSSESRRSETGTALYRREYIYEGIGRLIGDTLFEPSGSGWEAVQVHEPAYNADGTVSGERYARFSEGAWFDKKSTVMGYSEGRLAFVLEYDGGGTGKSLVDSLAVAYGANGYPAEEARFDEEGKIIERVRYVWQETTTRIRLVEARAREGASRNRRESAGRFRYSGKADYDVRGRDTGYRTHTPLHVR